MKKVKLIAMPRKSLCFTTNLIIAGNQAADLDSAVCAFTLSELLKRVNPEIRITPLIQGSYTDLRLKPDVEGLFNAAGRPLNTASFLEDAQSSEMTEITENSSLILVDHNEKDPDLPDIPVAGIVDHHKDSGLFQNLSLRDIRICGSCASIISEYWHRSEKSLSRDLALLLAGAIAVDTGFLDPDWGKTTDLDRREYSRLLETLTSSDIRYIEGLLDLKNDLSHLTMTEHLRRDYKVFSPAGLSGGIASLTLCRKDFFTSPFYNRDKLEAFMRENSRDFLILLHSFGTPLQRELSLYDPDSRSGVLQKGLDALSFRGVEPLSTEGPWLFFRIKDPKISRKVLMPLLAEASENAKDQCEKG